VKFGFHILLSVVLFLASIFYFVCCNLFFGKEKHKVVKYPDVGDSEIFSTIFLKEIREILNFAYSRSK
jgi:hypothetical protein